MASNDDLDSFFKKKDRKANKAKKQTGLLTNNEELLKQLVIVTSATTAFRENMDTPDDDDDPLPINDASIAGAAYIDEAPKHPKPKLPDRNKHPNEQPLNIASKTDGQQQDDWEEFEDVNSKYEQLRLKFVGGANGDDDGGDDYYDDENNPNNNDNNNDTTGDREQQKDKPVWKINRVQPEEQPQQAPEPVTEPKVEEPKPAPASSGVYRPPQMRGGSSVTVVSGANPPRASKKKEPNFASVDEFPTLGATVNKK